MKRYATILCLMLSLPFMALAQNDTLRHWHIDLKAGLNIGAATPSTMPVEIREIKGFNPHFNGRFSICGSYDFNKKWSLGMALQIEQMSMTTHARVKGYNTEITSEGSHIAGVWTGDVETTFKATALTMPLTIGLHLGDHVKIHAGLYGSYLINRHFYGNVHDGYLRKDNPTGEHVVFDGTSSASYEFDQSLRPLHVGILAGADFYMTKRLILSAQCSYGLLSIFENGFKTVSFDMHPLFANIAIGYRLW